MSSGRVRKAAGERAAAGVCRCSREPKNCQAARLAIPGENQGDYTKLYLYPLFLKKNGRDIQNCPKSHCNALLKLFIPK